MKYYCIICGNFGTYEEIGEMDCIKGLHTCVGLGKEDNKK